jgi:hypothetical protein
MNFKITGSLTLFLLIVFSTNAQNDSIPNLITDRPAQSESPSLLHKGFFQIETGVQYVDRVDPEKELERIRLGTTLIRYGVFSNFEVRLSDSYEWMHVQTKENSKDSTESGMGPVTVGFKVYVINEKGIRPAMSILGTITFRHLGDEVFSPTYSYPIGKLLCSHTLTKKISLNYNIGFGYGGENADGFFIYSGNLGYSFTPKFWAFIEVYGNFDSGNAPNNKGDAGFSYLIRKNLQVDLSAGMAFDNDIDRFFASTGLSWRIPR